MKIQASRSFTHHPSYVAQIHDSFREYLESIGYSSNEGEVTRDILLRKRYRSAGKGFVIETTLRDQHDNTLALIVNPQKCTLGERLKEGDLEMSFPDFKFIAK